METVKRHSSKEDITFFAACFCPFVQRVWVALEYLEIPYYYYECDPYQKPAELLEVSPKGLVPGLKLNNVDPPRALNESTVILEFLEDVADGTSKKSLLPSKTDPYARAIIRLQCDHVNRTLVPAFYRYLQAQDEEGVVKGSKGFMDALRALTELLQRGEREVGVAACGLWKEGGSLSLTDVMVGPWLFRAMVVLKHYRGFDLPESDEFGQWLDRLFNHPAFKGTCSTDQLYLDSYERYAFNRPNTSQVANAINSGQGLP